MNRTVFANAAIIVALLMVFAIELSAQETAKIPVYPGARLSTEKEGAVEPDCCEFITNDSFDKVIAFYQTYLKTKPMDTKQLAAAYPAMKEQLRQVEAQTPANVKYRAFVVRELVINGQKVPTVFELISNPSGVRFSLSENELTEKDSHFNKKPKRGGGPMTPAEQTGGSLIDWKRLQEILPTSPSLGGYKRGESFGETNSGSSSASVTYSKVDGAKSGGEDSDSRGVGITIMIEDVSNSPQMALEMSAPGGDDEKAIKVKGKYPGKQASLRNESGYETCEITFLVNKRFLVECKGEGMKDLALLNKFVDASNLDKLAGLK